MQHLNYLNFTFLSLKIKSTYIYWLLTMCQMLSLIISSHFHITPSELACCAVLSPSVVSDSLRPRGLWPARLLCPWGFSRHEYWSGLPCPSPGDLPNPGFKPRSPALQMDSLLSEPLGKPKNTGEGSLSLLQGIFPTQELNWGLLHYRWILYQLSYQGSPSSPPRSPYSMKPVSEYCHISPHLTPQNPEFCLQNFFKCVDFSA